MYEESIRDEFTHQTDSIAGSPVHSMAETLDAVVEMVPADDGSRWLETACGPAIVGRAVAARVGSVHGVDLTPAMVKKAAAEAAAAAVENIEFSLGDVTALEFEDASFDGAVTRFSLHHIPAPRRVLEEMARVVRPGGWVVLADHLTDADGDAAAWHEQIERLRDPSHWACLTRERLLAAGEAAGLVLDDERVIPLDLDFGEWLRRGSGGPTASALIDRLLDEAPPRAESFRVVGEGDERRLLLRNSITRWRVAG
ncbi:MAG TPA: methyltransferase domain-containing protein [Solirubrobacterales bacterium]|jgi:SAM-dependent methyltransferase|nr:methyltransferase domain-containing protein [Solirubrobacterales bacterium]